MLLDVGAHPGLDLLAIIGEGSGKFADHADLDRVLGPHQRRQQQQQGRKRRHGASR